MTVDLHVETAGEGPAIVLLHGLTATNHYVVMGSRRLERAGYRVIAYDARGHGASDPAPRREDYGYDELVGDLERVLDDHGLESAVLAGASMGAHTALGLARSRPERVAGLVLVTPAFEPGNERDPGSLARWDRLADGLASGGVEGFLDAYDLDRVPEQWRDTLETVLRQRLERHDRPAAVADALRAVPRSAPFDDLDDLTRIACPATVVGDRDEADPGHPLAVAARYAELLPDAELVVEEEGRSPLAWQGSQLSGVIDGLARRAGVRS